MRVWILQGVYEGELFSSAHLTEKGAALAAIADVLEFLGIDDEANALHVMDDGYYTSNGDKKTPIPWEDSKLRLMSSQELWKVFRAWSEYTWDNHGGYQIDVQRRQLCP